MKPENPFRHGTISWSLMEDDWSDLTAVEIADVLGVSEKSVRRSMGHIKRKTGYIVPYARGTWNSGNRYDLLDRLLVECLSSGRED